MLFRSLRRTRISYCGKTSVVRIYYTMNTVLLVERTHALRVWTCVNSSLLPYYGCNNWFVLHALRRCSGVCYSYPPPGWCCSANNEDCNKDLPPVDIAYQIYLKESECTHPMTGHHPERFLRINRKQVERTCTQGVISKMRQTF